MKPNFALSLSYEGIRLLHRAAGGWRVVGDIDLSAEDMPAELAALRMTASDLEPGGVRSKLIIPNDQIKYLTLDTGDGDDDARWAAAFAALDGATPYPVDELAVDICADGPQTHVAAVTRDTLREAESFAHLHRFNPVSFVAVPGDAGFLGEPFLGVANHADTLLEPGDAVEPDGIAVVVIGDVAATSGPVVADVPEPEAPEPETPEPENPVAPQDARGDDLGAPDTAPEDDAPTSAEPDDVATDDAPEDPVPVVPAPVAAETPTPKAKPAAPVEAEHADDIAPADAAAADLKPPSLAGFASRRPVPGKTPTLGGANRTDLPPVKAAPVASPSDVALPKSAPPVTGISDAAIPIDPDDTFEAPTQTARPVNMAKASVRGFISRRHAARTAMPVAETAAPAPRAPKQPISEAQRMTVFGARSKEPPKVGGKPRFLGLMLTVALLVFLAGVAAWAAVFMDEGIARFFDRGDDPAIADAPVGLIPETDEAAADGVQLASIEPALSPEDAAVLDALRDPQPDPEVPPDTEADLQDAERQAAEARYAVTGIWPLAPTVPEPAQIIPLEDLYITSIDPISPARDAVALPASLSFDTDPPLGSLRSPAAPGTNFELDDQGRVIPTPEGAVTPDGITLFLGRPPVVPPQTPTRFEDDPRTIPEADRLAAFRPQPRPSDLVEQTERATLGGLTRSELADQRPRLRPEVEREVEEVPDAPPTAQATEQSSRPEPRPRNFARIVDRARAAQPTVAVASAAPASAAAVASVAPQTVTPSIPSRTSVARAATVKNAINLRRVNLIGVYGQPSSRRALVRLANGRYKKVKVGDRIDGGRISAIGDSELRYQKGGRNVVLKMP